MWRRSLVWAAVLRDEGLGLTQGNWGAIMMRRLVTAGATAALAAGLSVVPTATAQASVPKGWNCSASQFGWRGN